MPPEYVIVANPAAGRDNCGRSIPQVEAILSEYGLSFEIVRTERPWHAAELAREAVRAGADVLVAMGGDGTANEVLNGLMRARRAGEGTCAMGVLCVGSGNDFAYGVGIPTEIRASCHTLAQGYRRTVDVGYAVGGLYPGGRYFGNGVGIGFDAVVGFEAAKLTRLRGFLAYAVAALKTIFLYYRAPLVTVEYDQQTVQQYLLMVSVMNGQRMGGGFYMAPEGKPDDGMFDLCLARQVSRARIFGLIGHFLRGTQATQEPIDTGQARHVVIQAIEGNLPAHADGETLCTDGQRLEIDLLPGELELICGPAEAATT